MNSGRYVFAASITHGVVEPLECLAVGLLHVASVEGEEARQRGFHRRWVRGGHRLGEAALGRLGPSVGRDRPGDHAHERGPGPYDHVDEVEEKFRDRPLCVLAYEVDETLEFGFQNPVRVAKIHVKTPPFLELFDESGEIPPNYPTGSLFLAVRGCFAKNLET